MENTEKRIVFKLKGYIEEMKISQKEFAKMAGLREATISQMCTSKYERIYLPHLLKVMETLKLKDFNDILEIEDSSK